MARQTDTDEGVITIRIPADLMEFIEEQAREQFNTRAGICRMALAKFREAVQANKAAGEGESSEPALSH